MPCDLQVDGIVRCTRICVYDWWVVSLNLNCRAEMRSVQNRTNVTVANSSGHVRSSAGCVQGVVPRLIISMHWTQTRFISAGMSMGWFYSTLPEVDLRQEHACPRECQQRGICDIATKPQAVESTFVGRFGQHQYTKVRLLCSSMTRSHDLGF